MLGLRAIISVWTARLAASLRNTEADPVFDCRFGLGASAACSAPGLALQRIPAPWRHSGYRLRFGASSAKAATMHIEELFWSTHRSCLQRFKTGAALRPHCALWWRRLELCALRAIFGSGLAISRPSRTRRTPPAGASDLGIAHAAVPDARRGFYKTPSTRSIAAAAGHHVPAVSPRARRPSAARAQSCGFTPTSASKAAVVLLHVSRIPPQARLARP